MNKFTTPYKHFDMTTTHLPENEGHYITPRTRDSSEAERRRAMPSGSIGLEGQTSGLIVAQHMIQHPFENTEDAAYLHGVIVPSFVNTGWYNGAQGAGDVSRRRWFLPELASDEGDGWRETHDGHMRKIHESMSHVVTLAHQLELAHKRGAKAESLRCQLGRAVGSVGIALACTDLGDAPETMSAYDIQAIVRLRALDTIQQSRQLVPYGTYGSVAQLARPDSPLSIGFIQQAPRTDEAAAVFLQAQEDFGLAA